jgi:hypothetical protein
MAELALVARDDLLDRLARTHMAEHSDRTARAAARNLGACTTTTRNQPSE